MSVISVTSLAPADGTSETRAVELSAVGAGSPDVGDPEQPARSAIMPKRPSRGASGFTVWHTSIAGVIVMLSDTGKMEKRGPVGHRRFEEGASGPYHGSTQLVAM
jgi:hypothetical protein